MQRKIAMNKIKIYHVDAFAEQLFEGNPAAVCFLDKWLQDEIMQLIAAENNLAETAFIVQKDAGFQIRWFTPTVEVDLCGHATLASAYVLFQRLGYQQGEVNFFSPRSGDLRVFSQEDMLFLDFPADKLKPVDEMTQIRKCIGTDPLEVLRGKSDFIAVVDSEEAVRNLNLQMAEIAALPARGLIVTAKGVTVDFVSRFFAPQSGIDEDPVTGSAHTSLIPLWSARLGKRDMHALQLSKRGGKLRCMDKGERCHIGGHARLYMTGEIYTS